MGKKVVQNRQKRRESFLQWPVLTTFFALCAGIAQVREVLVQALAVMLRERVVSGREPEVFGQDVVQFCAGLFVYLSCASLVLLEEIQQTPGVDQARFQDAIIEEGEWEWGTSAASNQKHINLVEHMPQTRNELGFVGCE